MAGGADRRGGDRPGRRDEPSRHSGGRGRGSGQGSSQRWNKEGESSGRADRSSRDGRGGGGRGPGGDRRPAGGGEGRRGAEPRRRRDDDDRPPRVEGPEIDEDVTGTELDREIRDELSGIGAAWRIVAQHLVMAARLLDEDPELARKHAWAARKRASRVGIVREAAGVASYRAGRYSEALGELRAARRMTGSVEYLPVMADCERGMGRPERALDLASDPAVTGLDTPDRVEMLIVAAGARRDMGQHSAAAAMLQVPELRADSDEEWVARLRYAYADALQAAGRLSEAHRWFRRVAETDVDEMTDAAERAQQLSKEPPR